MCGSIYYNQNWFSNKVPIYYINILIDCLSSCIIAMSKIIRLCKKANKAMRSLHSSIYNIICNRGQAYIQKHVLIVLIM